MLRRLFAVLSALSLLLCAAVVVLWVRSFRGGGDGDVVSRVVRGNRYTTFSQRGRLRVTGPPPAPASADVRRSVQELVGSLRNDQLAWKHWHTFSRGPRVSTGSATSPSDSRLLPLREFTFSGAIPSGLGTVSPRDGTAAALLEQRHPVGDCRRALLAATEDPDRFVAAHVLLTPRAFSGYRHYDSERTDLGQSSDPATFGGMSVTLRRPATPGEAERAPFGYVLVSIDPAQLPVVRDRWHRELAVPVAAAPHWLLACATALPPLLWSILRVRRAFTRRIRRRGGLCPVCGYDLRATPGGCPECGTAAGVE